MVALLLSVTLLLALAWVPIIIKFFRAWRERHNPVSLAICGVILLVVYTNTVVIGIYAFEGNLLNSTAAICIFNGIICANFYVADRWSRRKFPNTRGSSTPPPKA